jgi:hypothetical protein
MVSDGVQSCLLIRNPLKHDAILVVNRETKESSILPMQFMYLESLMIASVSERFNLLKDSLLLSRIESF